MLKNMTRYLNYYRRPERYPEAVFLTRIKFHYIFYKLSRNLSIPIKNREMEGHTATLISKRVVPL